MVSCQGRFIPSVPVVYVKLVPAEEALILATMDPLATLAVTDKDKLADLMASVTVSDEGLREHLRDTAGLGEEAKEGGTDPDEVPRGRATEVQPGDLFELSCHHLLYEDCTAAGVPGEFWCFVTDPPYGVGVAKCGMVGATPARGTCVAIRTVWTASRRDA